MRIVHAVSSTAFAGVERYVATACNTLASRGHEVVVITNDEEPMRAALNAAVPVVRAAGTVGMTKALVAHTRGADIVHVHMTAAEVAAVMARGFARPALVATRHFPDRRGSSVPGRLAAPLVVRAIDVQLAISQFVASAIAEPTEVLRNGVANRPSVDPTPRVVLVAQRLEAEKRTEDALAAWDESDLASDGWEMRIAGDGVARESLESRSSTSVRFLGQRHDLDALRADAGIFLATAPAEPFGLSVAESMAAGLPVVAAGGGGHLETVGAARPDLLYAPGDTRASAALLRTFAGEIELRRAAGRDLRAFQQQELDLEHHVDRLAEVYERVRKRPSP